jgi:acyl-homoserine-lactone acylase
MFSIEKIVAASLTIVALVVLPACNGGANTEVKDQNLKSEFSAQIRRTEFGVPHIVAPDEKGIGFGVGYAYAQDNFCLLADSVVTVAGERSKYWGLQASYKSTYGTEIPNPASDLYYKVINAPELVDLSWNNQPSDSADLLKGYAAGVNRYLNETGRASLPTECKNGSWVRDITEQDLMRLIHHFAMLADSEPLIGGLITLVPPQGAMRLSAPQRTAAMAKRKAVLRGLVERQLAMQQARIGSNGVALGTKATESGRGLLLANPHFSWDGITRFYQLHLTIPGKLDVMGASLSGLPIVNIGFNNDIAWTHTINTSNHSTYYLIALDATDPTRYTLDNQPRQLQKNDVVIEYVDVTNGAVKTLSKSVYFSEHGPILQWDRSAAIALKSANLNNDRLVRQWWAMNKAKNLDELQTALETIIGVPWAQTIATNKAADRLRT